MQSVAANLFEHRVLIARKVELVGAHRVLPTGMVGFHQLFVAEQASALDQHVPRGGARLVGIAFQLFQLSKMHLRFVDVPAAERIARGQIQPLGAALGRTARSAAGGKQQKQRCHTENEEGTKVAAWWRHKSSFSRPGPNGSKNADKAVASELPVSYIRTFGQIVQI